MSCKVHSSIQPVPQVTSFLKAISAVTTALPTQNQTKADIVKVSSGNEDDRHTLRHVIQIMDCTT